MKRCYACEVEKSEAEFAVDPSKASGRKSICRPCDRVKARGYYVAHRPAVLARQRAQKAAKAAG